MDGARDHASRVNQGVMLGQCGRVLIVGDVIDDMVVQPLTPTTIDSDTTSTIRRTSGGSAANQAAWLGSLGVPVRFVGRVGLADVERHRLELANFGVDAVLIADHEAPTGTIVVLLGVEGDRTMYTDRGANLRLGSDDVPVSLLDDVDVLHVNGYALFSSGGRAAVVALMEESRRRDIAVTVDPCSVAFLREFGVADFLGCTRGSAVCLPNLDEGRVLTGLVEPGEIVESLAAHYGVVALTLGAGGVLVGAGGEVWSVPSSATSVVDPTGAGDAFCAGFLCRWIGGAAPRDAAQFGSDVAARALSVFGGRPVGRLA
jgi:sugar/nucleoside kinase (ribokinase family)